MKKILFLAAAVVATVSLNAQMTWGVKAGVGFDNYNISLDKVSAKINPGTKTGFYVGAVNNIAFSECFGLQTELMYNYGGANFLLKSFDQQMTDDAGNTLTESTPKLKLSINTHNITLPVMVKFSPAANLSVMAGPYFSYRAGLKVATNNSIDDAINGMLSEAPINADKIKDVASELLSDNLSKFDVGASLGVEYAFNNGFFIDARYNFSFLNSLKKELDPKAINDFAKEHMGATEDAIPGFNYEDALGMRPTVKRSSLQIGVGFRF